jgi:hypothetical protein
MANVREIRRGHIVKTPAYERLDPTEKGAISYFLGMAVSKLMADKKLGVAYLMHLEVYQEQIEALYGPVHFGRGKSRPDLIGLDKNYQWVVMESKGRSGLMTNALMNKAKRQSTKLRSVGGQIPILNVASVIYFQDDRMKMKWQDPSPHSEAMDFDFISAFDIVRKYYQPFWALSRNNRLTKTFKSEYEIRLEALDITIYLPKILSKLYDDIPMEDSQLREILSSVQKPNLRSRRLEQASVTTTILSDGIGFKFGNTWINRLNKQEDDDKRS